MLDLGDDFEGEKIQLRGFHSSGTGVRKMTVEISGNEERRMDGKDRI